MQTIEQIISKLKTLGNKDKVIFKEQKFGIKSKNCLGIYQSDLSNLAKQIGKNNQLAVALFDTGIYEAKILCSKLYNPKDLTEMVLEKWVKTFDNWEICDSFCMALTAKSKFAIPKAIEWTNRKNEFEKRAGFTTIAAFCMANKNAENKIFEQFFPIIEREATDERIYVKKAVNWALRNIGKRNIDLNKEAIKTANRIYRLDNKTAKWIAKDALKELESEKINILDYPREIYRTTGK